MTEAWFEYKGINSLDMHLKIENEISFPSPEADIELVEVPGRDGELAIDNQRLKGSSFPIPVTLRLPPDRTVEQVATKLSEWLKTDIGWYPLRFSGSPDHEYTAIFYEQFNVQETLKQFGRTVLTFHLKPHKRRIGQVAIQIDNGGTLYNPEKRVSKPLLYIEGSGDIALQNNGVTWLILTDVSGHITVDSEAMSVYKDEKTEFTRMNSNVRPLFPLLYPGQNTITWTGNVTKVDITPRWEAVI